MYPLFFINFSKYVHNNFFPLGMVFVTSDFLTKTPKITRWDLLDSYGLREKFKDLLYAAAKTPDAKPGSVPSNGSNEWMLS